MAKEEADDFQRGFIFTLTASARKQRRMRVSQALQALRPSFGSWSSLAKTVLRGCALLIFTVAGAQARPHEAYLDAKAHVIQLHVTPGSLTDIGSEPILVLITGLRGAPKITVRDLQYLDVSKPTVDGSAAAFNVTRVAAGETTITISDASGSSVTLPVSNAPCLPEPPHLVLLLEQIAYPGSAHEAVRSSVMFFYTHLARPEGTADDGRSYTTRLIGSDGSVLRGSQLVPITNTRSELYQRPPTPAPGDGTVYYSETLPLKHNVSYRVQLLRAVCEGSSIVGSFSTR